MRSNYLKKFFRLFLSINLVLSTFTFVFTQNIKTSLDIVDTQVEVGQEVVVNLWLDPDAKNKVFTVTTNLVYDPSVLEFLSSDVSSGWFEVKQGQHYKDDKINGLIIRTAGYPGGFFSRTKFITFKFKAKKAGSTDIFVASGNAFDNLSADLGLGSSSLRLNILESNKKPNRVEVVKEGREYDVSVKIKSDTAFYRQEDFIFSVYHPKEDKFQRAVTKIWVFDEDWNVHYTDEKLWLAGSDTAILQFKIPANTIVTEGNFKIIAKVRFEDGTEYGVIEKDVGVLSNGETWFSRNLPILKPIFVLVIFAAVLHHIFMEREVYFQLKKLLKTSRKRKIKK